MNYSEWNRKLKKILHQLGILTYKNLSIYQEAFTHKSYANENQLKYNQQRLEFLGDSAISWVISNYLYSIKPKISEGEMTITKSRLVSTEALARAAKDIQIDELLIVGKGLSPEKITNKILEDTFEAFVGAIAQDQGIKKVIKLLDLTLVKYHKKNLIKFNKDYKTQFQELIQSTCSNAHDKIKYVNEVDKDNANVKISKLYYMDNLYGLGRGKNFKEAEQQAAKEALSKCQNKK